MGLKAGTRESVLALWQTQHVADELARVHGVSVELVGFSTKGDRVLDVALNKVGGKSLFTQELEDALRTGAIDLAVHSLKDLPTRLPDGLELACILPRGPVYDALCLPADSGARPLASASEVLAALPKGSVIGTSSPRRAAQLRRAFPHLEFESVRGNVQTRLRKLDARDKYAAIVLAEAGLVRLGLEGRVTARLAPPLCLPAVGQGALAVEIRADNDNLRRLLAGIHCSRTAAAVTAERSFLCALGGGCSVPVGALAEVNEDTVTLSGTVLDELGSRQVNVSASAPISQASELGERLAAEVKEKDPTLLEELARLGNI